jgi:hypothetical protein
MTSIIIDESSYPTSIGGLILDRLDGEPGTEYVGGSDLIALIQNVDDVHGRPLRALEIPVMDHSFQLLTRGCGRIQFDYSSPLIKVVRDLEAFAKVVIAVDPFTYVAPEFNLMFWASDYERNTDAVYLFLGSPYEEGELQRRFSLGSVGG